MIDSISIAFHTSALCLLIIQLNLNYSTQFYDLKTYKWMQNKF